MREMNEVSLCIQMNKANECILKSKPTFFVVRKEFDAVEYNRGYQTSLLRILSIPKQNKLYQSIDTKNRGTEKEK